MNKFRIGRLARNFFHGQKSSPRSEEIITYYFILFCFSKLIVFVATSTTTYIGPSPIGQKTKNVAKASTATIKKEDCRIYKTMNRKHSTIDCTPSGNGAPVVSSSSTPSSPSPSNSGSGSSLPAQVWGNIMDYLRYADVRSTLSTCRSIRMDAPSYVSVVTIEEPEELNNVDYFERHFTNVTTVNLICLLRFESDNQGYIHSVELRHDCIPLIVPFLISIPRLEHVFLGNYIQKNRITYWRRFCQQPTNHETYFCQLIESICDAYKTGSIKQTVEILGVFNPRKKRIHRCTPGGCRTCHTMCSSIPLAQVLKFGRMARSDEDESGLTVSRRSFHELLRSRSSKSDLDACLPKVKEIIGTLLTNSNFITFYKDPNKENNQTEEDKMLIRYIGNKDILEHVGIPNWEDEIDINFFSADIFDDVKTLMNFVGAVGFSPQKVARNQISEFEMFLRYMGADFLQTLTGSVNDYIFGDKVLIQFYSEDIFDRIQFMIDHLELSPQSISREEITEWKRYCIPVDSAGTRIAKRPIIVKSSFDRFVQMGFTGFVEEDFCIVDETMEECVALNRHLETYRNMTSNRSENGSSFIRLFSSHS